MTDRDAESNRVIPCVRSLCTNGPASCCLPNCCELRYSLTNGYFGDREFQIDRLQLKMVSAPIGNLKLTGEKLKV